MYEYSWFIEKIRQYNAEEEIEKAVDRALEEMPEEFCIKRFLIANREEVRMSILTEYDEQKTMNLFKEEGREEERELAEKRERDYREREEKREQDHRERYIKQMIEKGVVSTREEAIELSKSVFI